VVTVPPRKRSNRCAAPPPINDNFGDVNCLKTLAWVNERLRVLRSRATRSLADQISARIDETGFSRAERRLQALLAYFHRHSAPFPDKRALRFYRHEAQGGN
jgi:hypothetical protein